MSYYNEIAIVARENPAKELLAVNAREGMFTVTEGKGGEWLFYKDAFNSYEPRNDLAAYFDIVDKYLELGEAGNDGIAYLIRGEGGEEDYGDNGNTSAILASTIDVGDFEPKEPEDTTPPEGKRYAVRHEKRTVTVKCIYEVPADLPSDQVEKFISGIKPIDEIVCD